MEEDKAFSHSAASSALGYLYQVRYALLEALRRLRNSQEFLVNIETLDDIVFDAKGQPTELLQTKHHVNNTADLTDASPDLWKSLRIWCERLVANELPDDALFFLITTALAGEGHAASYLKADGERDVQQAMLRLNATAESSRSKANKMAYEAYRRLNLKQREQLLERVVVIDGSPSIRALDRELKEVLFFAVEERFFGPFLVRLEGWWYGRVIRQLVAAKADPILAEELSAETSLLREQFKLESLPIDDDIMTASVDATGYHGRPFVHQLRLIQVNDTRILYAIRNFFRAFEQRSRWLREDLLLVGELDRYEDQLIEEWDVAFQQMSDELGESAAEDAMKSAAQTLYKWVESGTHRQIRPGVTESFVSRGTYQMLSDAQRVGWHVQFKERLRELLEPKEVS